MAGHRMGVSAIGLVWYKRADYRRILEVMEDSEKLPLTFGKWQSQAETLERKSRDSGEVVVRAHIDPEHFVTWCADNQLHVDSHARNLWAAEVARREISDAQH